MTGFVKTPELGIIALTPQAWTGKDFHPGIAIAASRAGAIGVVDLEYIESSDELKSLLNSLPAVSGEFGIRCGAEQLDGIKPSLEKLSAQRGAKQLYVIICVRDRHYDKKSLAAVLQYLQKLKFAVICEAVNIQEAILAQEAGADAVVARGNECGGRVGEETSFVLLQRLVKELKLPVWVQGGVGLHSAAAVLAAGAKGIVLDSQLLLTRESPLSIEQKEKLSNFDGTETEVISHGKEQFRVCSRPADDSLKSMLAERKANVANAHLTESMPLPGLLRHFLTDAARSARSQLPAHCELGQDIAFAASLARRYGSVAALVTAIKAQARFNLDLAAKQQVLAEGAALAASHGMKYPILQGAMTRVSDTAEFALKVQEGGGLPFLALALMRKAEIQPLLEESCKKLSGGTWGVGMLGFVPPELRQEQLQLVLEHRPPCALIAGGRPDQAKELEAAGIKTYLHVPSPALLESFVEMGAKRFIFEGKECGGHVGPRSSFVLWECMIETLLNSVPPKANASEYHIVFAGGIHDTISAAMVATMAASLVERGMRIGVLMGTAYLFTEEAVSSGAIVPKFQDAALKCKDTVLLETGPGHAIRCIDSPYKKVFDEKRKKLESDGCGKNELRQELELMNLGRLRVASKGLARSEASASAGSKLVKVSDDKQWSDGMYMIGQVASLHDKVTNIKKLHESVSIEADKFLKSQNASVSSTNVVAKTFAQKQEAIAIVGMSCLFPKANDLETYWQNIINKVNTIEEIPAEQWDWTRLYSEDPLARDKVFSKWGGFLKDIPFDPSNYGIPPASLASVDPMQLLILEVTRAALHDAGYQKRSFPKDRTSIVLANAGHGPITAFYSLRSMLDWTLSDLDPQYRKELEKRLPEWTEDSFPGYLGNVVAGRVANRFDLGGINFCVDAACASSLAALYIGLNELRSGTSDMVLLAATDTHNQPGDYLSFSKTHALSPRGRCRTFDATADGIVISEGLAVLVLKRLSDAERDGDRIYALIRGIGGSSDGRDLSLTAPRPAGQMVALERAYEDAGISPSTVELVEAHGTGTVAGDKAEFEALRNVFEKYGADKQVCALGSVKTMIGHTKCTAGLASVIKVARSLYHRVLPPTIGVEVPNPACQFEASPFYLNTEARPWIHDSESLSYPRRAGVSAFGFGGTNFHAVLEEYQGQKLDRQESAICDFPTELFSFRTASRANLERQIDALENNCKKMIEQSRQPKGPLPIQEVSSLFELAYRHHLAQSSMPSCSNQEHRHHSLAIIAGSAEDLLKKIEQAKTVISDESKSSFRDPRGIFFAETPHSFNGKLAFLFPGQGSQQVNMLGDLSLAYSCVQDTFRLADNLLAGKFEDKLSRYTYPTPVFAEEQRKAQQERLTDTHIAQPAVAAADMAAFSLLTGFGLEPDMVGGHSFGEYVALAAAGSLSVEDLFRISEKRGAILKSTNGKKTGSMAAVSADGNEVRRLIANLKDVTLANLNSPKQCIISGEISALNQARGLLDEKKLKSKPIAVSAAFHSPLMEPALKQLSKALLDLHFERPRIPVYSNTLAKPYPNKPEQMASLLCEHLVKPVEFQQQIEQMHESGARIFVECGPGTVLTGLVSDILAGKDHLAISLERNGKHGITQLQFLLAQVITAGLDVDLAKLYKHRVENLLPEKSATKSKGKLTYMINGSHVKRFDGKQMFASNRPAEESLRHIAGKTFTASKPAQQAPAAAPQLRPAPGPNMERKAAPPTTATPRIVAATNEGERILVPAPEPVGMPQSAMQVNPIYAAQAPVVTPPQTQQSNQGQRIPANNTKAQVLLEFQRNMLEMSNSFLQAQERVMLSYLQKGSAQPVQGTPPFPNGGSQLAPKGSEQLPITITPTVPVLTSEKNGSNGNGHHPIDSEFLIAKLIEIVSERTGYPPEMLDPSLDLEADLGIDSIKRVEILNSFRKLLPEEVQEQLESGIEKLASTRTLEGIIDWIRTDLSATKLQLAIPVITPVKPAASTAAPAAAAATASQPTAQKNGKASLIGRALVETKELPLLKSEKLKLSGLYLITDSEDGLAELIATEISNAGGKTLILKHKDSKSASYTKNSSKIELDLCTEESVNLFAKELFESSVKPAGIIHLLPLNKKYASLPGRKEAASSYALLRSLFMLAREILSPASKEVKDFKLLAATRLGGSFAAGEFADFNPIHAAVPGMIKSLAREITNSTSRCLDFASELKKEKIAEHIIAELGNDDKTQVEVAYSAKQRLTAVAAHTPVKQNTKSQSLDLDKSSLILVTGGARGITTELCLELAQKHKPHFAILGRGQRPANSEPVEYKNIEGQRELKAAIMNKLRQEGKAISVPAIEAIYQQLIKDREIRNNLSRLEAAGARVHYYPVDVRDHQSFSELIDKLYESFGKIDAVIHGAGVIEDAYIKDKSLASFDRVFSTKIDSALTLATRLDLDTVKYLIFFSSVVGRTGNAGQIDYVAANEVLNKLAIKLNQQSRARVLSIGWGPWRGGMAQSELESVFARFGWSMIESQDGRNNFYDELCHGSKSDAEVLLVGQLPGTLPGGNGNGSGSSSQIRARGARLNRAEVLKQGNGSMQLRLRLDPEFDLYLKDHTFNGLPVLPMAVVTELFSEAAQFMCMDLKLSRLQKLDIPQGIVFENGAKDLFINLNEVSRSANEVVLELSLCTSAAAKRKNFVAQAVLSTAGCEHNPASTGFSRVFAQPKLKEAETQVPTVRFIYDNWLFHGPIFQGIDGIEQMGINGISGRLHSVPIGKSLKESGKETWLVDPLLIDSAMQLAGVWARHYMDITVLPVGFKALHVYANPTGQKFKAIVRVPEESKNGELLCDMAVYSDEGQLILLMEGLGGTGSKSLNKLASRSKDQSDKQ